MARLAATLRIAAHRSAIKLDFSIAHDSNSVLILCIIVVAVFLSRVVGLFVVTVLFIFTFQIFVSFVLDERDRVRGS